MSDLDRDGGRTKPMTAAEREFMREHGDKLVPAPRFKFRLIEPIETPHDEDSSWPPPPSGRQYKRDGTPEELLKELREALAVVSAHLGEAQGDHDCCYAGITESYCGIFGCTPDGCYGHEQDCPCDQGTAIRFLLEMADDAG